MATDFRSSRWLRPPSWIPVSMQIQCYICVFCHILNIPTEFGDGWFESKEMATDFRNSRWRPPSSWISVNVHFWCNSNVLCQILNILTNFGEDWSDSKEMATNSRNSRWWRQPSWKIHFQLNRHYEKITPGLLLPIESLTFWGLSWRFRVVYSREL